MNRAWRLAALLCAAGAMEAGAKSFLFYGPLYVSGSYEVVEASKPGNTLTVWNEATWSSKATADFSAFDAIVFGEGFGSFATAAANANVWSPAVTGRIFIVGTDPDTHGKSLFVEEGVEFAASGCGTGLYMILGHEFEGTNPFTPVPFLAGFGAFTARNSLCSDAVSVISPLPGYLSSFTTLTTTYLGGWMCSTHEVLDAIPPAFDGVANEVSLGLPYLVARDSLGQVTVSLSGAGLVTLGQAFPVLVTVDDSGCGGASGVSATLTAASGSGAAVRLTGPAPASIASIASGASGTFTWTFSASGVGTVGFSATVFATVGSQSVAVAASRTVLVQTPAVLAGSIAAPAQVCVGIPYIVTVTVTNTGEADASLVTATVKPGVAGTAPAVLTGAPPTGPLIRGGEMRVYSWTFTSTQTGSVALTLSVSGQDANAAWPVTTGLLTSPAVTVVAPAALEAAAVAPGLTPVGTLFQVTLTVTNTGAIPVTGLTPVLGKLPPAAPVSLVSGPGTAASLPAGSATTFIWTYSVTGWGQVTFTATAAGADACHVVSAAAASAVLLGTPATLVGSPLTAQPDPVCAGAVVTVRLSVTNTGDVAALVVTGAPGPLPVGSGSAALRSSPPVLAQLPGGSATVLTWTFTVSGAGPVSFSVTISAADARDSTPLSTGLQGSNAITIQSAAALAALAAGPSGTLLAGSWAVVTFTVTNTGGSTSTGVSPSASVAAGGALAVLQLGPTPPGPVTLAPGAAVTFTWTYSVAGSGVVAPQLSATASGCGGQLAPVTTGVPLLVRGPAMLEVVSVLLPTAAAGGATVLATASVRNSGDVPLTVTAVGCAVSGPLVAISSPVSVPFGLAPGGSTTFTWSVLTRTVCGAGAITVVVGGTDDVSGLPLASTLSSNGLAVSGVPAALSVSVTPATANQGTPVSLRALVTDSCGFPVDGAVLTLVVLTGGGSLSALNAKTDAAGVAVVGWILGPLPGGNSARITLPVAGVTADVAATGTNPLALGGPGQGGLSANRIDPWRGEVAIARYYPATDEPVAVRIYTASGRLVRTLTSSQPMGGGQWMAVWDGKTADEFPVARGVYLVRVTGGGLNLTLKIVVAPH